MVPGPIHIVRERVSRADLVALAAHRFGDMVKAVVDVHREIMALGGELHVDEEACLLDDGSVQANLWGINLYPGEHGEAFIEFDSMINVRPAQGNPSRDGLDEERRRRIHHVVARLVVE